MGSLKMKLGEIIDKKYKIVGILGQGGTAQVLLAENIALNNIWAIKMLSKSSQWISYEMEEVEILKGLSHPMLPRLADLFEDEYSIFIVMDYFPGSNLLDILQKEGKVSEKVLKKWTVELLEVFEYLHSRIPPVIYRDLKPSNMIVDDTGRLRLVDFGTAKFYREGTGEDTIYIGTQGYAAPEQYGSGQSDQRTDLFNLGMTLVHLATGIHPLKSGAMKIESCLKKAGISKGFIKFILGLIETDPTNRFQSAKIALKAINKDMKPLVLNKCYKKEAVHDFRGVIGIASYLPGTGVTALCIALGRYLSKNKKNTALIELNNSGDFSRIGEVFDNLGELRVQRNNNFEALDMIFYPNMSDSGEISRKGVDVVILDLGKLDTGQKLKELNRADIKLILCPRAPWKYSLFAEYDEGVKSLSKDEWIYITCISENTERQVLKRRFKHIVIYSYPEIPYYLTEEEQKNTERTFKEICLITEKKQG